MHRVMLNAALVGCSALGLAAAAPTATAQRCGVVCRPQPVCGGGGGVATVIGAGGSYGNAGFGAGYSIQIGRTLSATSWCNPGFAAGGCGPRWGGGCRPWGWNACAPCGPGVGYGGWSFGWPGCGIGGWYGGGAFLGAESVFVAGSGGALFSGALRPWALPFWYGGYPANWWPGYAVTPFGTFFTPYGTLLPPGVGPRFGPAGVFPLPGFGKAAAGGGRAVAQQPAPSGLAADASRTRQARAARAVRASTESGRRRAAGHLAAGDRRLREAGGDPAQLRAALASYRQAAAAERDAPDTYIRLAIAQAALGDRSGVDASLASAVALDRRLAGTGGNADPIFGGAQTSPLAARGHAIIMEIAAADPVAGMPLAWLAESWSANWTDALGGLAAAGP